MSYDENSKRMLALTYYKQSANMLKHSGNTIGLLYKTASNQDTAKGHLVTHNRGGGTGPELSVEGDKRNATQTQSDVRMCSLQGPLLLCESTVC